MIYPLLRRLLFQLDPETAHEVGVRASSAVLNLPGAHAFVRQLLGTDDPCQVGPLRLPNRVGLAAGFDKDARWISEAEALGFGHIEVGAVTPRPQPGHPRPRLFRIPELHALRNRMGFNNAGALAIRQRLARGAGRRRIVVGVNLGKNADTPLERAADDYCRVAELLDPVCDYMTLNISSPNTAGLRSLTQEGLLAPLLQSVRAATRKPLFLKLSPDEDPLDPARLAQQHGFDGLIFSNTTASRTGAWQHQDPLGGISGPPLRDTNLAILPELARVGLPILGAGGIETPEHARRYLQAGATAVQLYTGFIYGGPLLPSRIARALRNL